MSLFCVSLNSTTADPDWTSFVYWVVTATFYAEDIGIDSSSFNEMPEVFAFGEDLRQMFRSSVLAMGSYADIYERNLECAIPRCGLNKLNSLSGANPGARLYLLPGLIT